jgi:hypothetical protein
MNNVPIFLEHIHLFDGLNRLHVEFLEGGLEFLIVGAGGFVYLFGFSAGGAFSSDLC